MTAQEAKETDRITLYGIPSPVKLADDSVLILFCGFSVHQNDVRQPSSRNFMIKHKDITGDTIVDGFHLNGDAVHAYDLPLTAEILEVNYRPIHIGAEIAGITGGTIGGLLASRISNPTTNPDEISPAAIQLEKMRELRAGREQGDPDAAARYCGTLRQSYTWCGIFWVSLDPDGADCDPPETLPA